MAERRMFAKSVVKCDEFHTLPIKSQYLYFQMGVEADDDGFLNNPVGVLKFNECTEDDLLPLISDGWIFRFLSGVVVILDWLVSNDIKADRYHPTVCAEEFSLLIIVKKKRYKVAKKNEPDTSCVQNVSGMTPDCIQNVTTMDTQLSSVKDRQDKFNLGESAHNSVSDDIRGELKNYGRFKNISLSTAEYNEIVEGNLLTTLDNLSLYMKQKEINYPNHFATIIKWNQEDNNIKKSGLPDYSIDSEKKKPMSQQEIDQLREKLIILGTKKN
jgi:hypothetical protein